MRSLTTALAFLSVLVVASDALAQVPTYVKRPEFVTDVSKRTDDLVAFLKRAKKEIVVVEQESAAQLTVELVSLTVNAGAGDKTTHAVGAGILTTRAADTRTATLRICVPAKDHCEEVSATSSLGDSVAVFDASGKVKKFAKDNAAALR